MIECIGLNEKHILSKKKENNNNETILERSRKSSNTGA